MAAVGTEPWTAAQVEPRRSKPIREVVAEWSELGPRCEARIEILLPGLGTAWVADAATHEHDVRGALGTPGARDSAATAIALAFIAETFVALVRDRGLPSLRLRAGGREWVAGDDQPVVTLAAEPFELLRALSGRRSIEQIRGLAWKGDPEPYLPAFTFGPFTPPAAPLVE